MVEFAISLPLLMAVACTTIDVGRLIYAYTAISNATREGARLVSLNTAVNSDCDALNRMLRIGQGFPLAQDPNSVAGANGTSNPNNVDPNLTPMPAGAGPKTPPSGLGYVYIYPAVAPSTSTCSSSYARPHPSTAESVQTQGGGGQNPVQNVAVEIQYNFQPLTPFVSTLFPNVLVVKSTSIQQAQY